MSNEYTVKSDITKESSEDAMVAALLGLRALQLQGIIEPQRFRVECLHIVWCSREAGIGDTVTRRVNEEVNAIEDKEKLANSVQALVLKFGDERVEV